MLLLSSTIPLHQRKASRQDITKAISNNQRWIGLEIPFNNNHRVLVTLTISMHNRNRLDFSLASLVAFNPLNRRDTISLANNHFSRSRIRSNHNRLHSRPTIPMVCSRAETFLERSHLSSQVYSQEQTIHSRLSRHKLLRRLSHCQQARTILSLKEHRCLPLRHLPVRAVSLRWGHSSSHNQLHNSASRHNQTQS